MSKIFWNVVLASYMLIFVFLNPSHAAPETASIVANDLGVVPHILALKPISLEEKDITSFERPERKWSPLMRMKWYQLNGDYSACQNIAQVSVSLSREIGGWYFVAWGDCLKSFETKAIQKWTLSLKANLKSLGKGPWDQRLSEMMWDFIKPQIESQIKLASVNTLNLVKMFDLENESRERKASLYAYMGDYYQAKRHQKESIYFWTLSYKLVPQKALAAKLSLKGIEINDAESSLIGDAEEALLTDELRKLHEKKEWDLLIKKVSNVLSERASSKLANQWSQKIPEMYINLARKSSELKRPLQNLKDVMSYASPIRQEEWARIFHKKGEYQASLDMTELALLKLANSPLSTSLFWMCGRNAHFLGLYDKAMNCFESLNKSNPMSVEAVEGQFRNGLMFLRQEKWAEASQKFKYLISLRGAEKYEASSRYWLIRSLQKFDVPESENQSKLFLEKYPYTYFALKLLSEKNKNSFVIPFSENLDQKTALQDNKPSEKKLTLKDLKKLKSEYKMIKIFWLPSQEATWKRAEILGKNGWWSEASAELSRLPEMMNGEQKLAMIYRAFEVGAFPLAIKWLSEMTDFDPQYFQPQYFKLGFPKVFDSLIYKESSRQKISSYLVRALMRQESAFGMRASSVASAYGLMQLIPSTGKEVATELNLKNIEVPEDLARPDVNIKMGTYYLAKMIKLFDGNVPMALAAYNAGPGKMLDWIQLRPEIFNQKKNPEEDPFAEIWYDELPWSESVFYIKAIFRNSIIYQILEKGSWSTSKIFWKDLTSHEGN
jgi:soluble lytic murein transglycosylase